MTRSRMNLVASVMIGALMVAGLAVVGYMILLGIAMANYGSNK